MLICCVFLSPVRLYLLVFLDLYNKMVVYKFCLPIGAYLVSVGTTS